ncbi:unnamed protein product [Peronospora belbahrii]|uniref:FYVE-type domain-containing protein n=1 Tax=Peronospora belbahrii TaxID=622444 RepID=A0ABN8CS17_9STRA|nr:unnamed protein product [Peronospora belbahrii]
MYGAMWLSGHERAARAHFTSDNVHDGAVLCSIVMPSSANPFRSLSVKWALKRAPHGGLVVKDRDFCYLSATGIVHSPQTGVKLGYRLRHSIIFPSCPPFQNHSVIRGQIFLCSFFRQQQNGKVLVFHEGKYDVGGGTGAIGLGLPKLIAEKSILETLLSLQNVCVCALAKKLARAVEETEAKQAVASISSTSVRESLDGERRCGMCLRRLGNALKRRCAACRYWTCSQCSVRQEIVPSARFRWMNGPMAARCFCKACVATVLRDNSAQYASQDANEDNYNVTCGRWDHDNISEEDDNDDEVLCMPNLRQSIKLFSADLQYSEVEYLSCQRGVRTLSTSLPCSTRNGYQDSVSTKQLSIGAKAMKTVNSFLPDYRRRRNSTLSVIPDLTNGGQTLERCRARYCCSTRAPDILLRSDVGRRNWASSASALSLESPQRHIDGSPIVNYHFRRSTV